MTSRSAAPLAGLAVAWGGTALLLSPAVRLLGDPDRPTTKLLEELVLWMLAAIVGAIVVFWERRPLASIGFRPLHWSSVAWGIALAAATIAVVMPSLGWLLHVAGIPAFEAGLASALSLPLWLRGVAVVTAAVVEDTLFVGYAFTRLAGLMRNRWLAGALAVAVFAVLHFPNWGVGPVLAYFAAIGIAVGFFAWRRDLLANIVAHAIVDGMALL